MTAKTPAVLEPDAPLDSLEPGAAITLVIDGIPTLLLKAAKSVKLYVGPRTVYQAQVTP